MQARARAVMLTNYTEVARHFGLDPYAMLGRCGLHPSSLRDASRKCRRNAHRLAAFREGTGPFGASYLGLSRSMFMTNSPSRQLLTLPPPRKSIRASAVQTTNTKKLDVWPISLPPMLMGKPASKR